ncbi:MAG: hypothetical protein L0Y66_10350 [Myxococcaceae bacterium]|nr:hypothetical protein [Myxococcaceae bacterium]
MADIKSKETSTRANLDRPSDEELRTANEDPEEMERRARHQPPGEERRDVTDREDGEDRIQRKGIGFDEDADAAVRREPPLRDKSRE